MSKCAPLIQSWVPRMAKPDFNLQMTYAATVGVVVCVIGFRLTSIQVGNVGSLWLALASALVVVTPLALLLREFKRFYLAEALLTIFWALFYYIFLFLAAALAGRLGRGIALQDSRFIQFDRWLHVDIPGIAAWSSVHWFGRLANRCYPLLFPFMWTAVLLPTLAGKVRNAQKFITANVAAFSVSLPLFALLPAIGPWYGYHLPMDIGEIEAQTNLFLLRAPGPYSYRPPSGVICFPSFHVIWAILCVQAVWGFRSLRIPASLFAGIIIFSTMSTGLHYICDVMGGILVAILAIVAANRLCPINSSAVGSAATAHTRRLGADDSSPSRDR